MPERMPRRRFGAQCLGTAAAAAATAWLGKSRSAKAAPSSTSGRKICAFTKPLQSLSYDELADKVAAMGFDGIEAPVRDGGHIEPAKVEEELPKMVAALKQRGLEITVLASSISRCDEPHTEKVLRTAARLGIRRYRMAHLRYDLNRPVVDQIKELRPSFKELAAMNREIGIAGVYQNHAGTKYVGGPVWDLYGLLYDIPVEEIGMAYDIRHATVEGGTTWPLGFNVMRPHIGVVYVKDFQWVDGKVRNVPLGEGLVSKSFFTILKKSNYTGDISLHEEYLSHRDPAQIPEHIRALKKDLKTLKSWLTNA